MIMLHAQSPPIHKPLRQIPAQSLMRRHPNDNLMIGMKHPNDKQDVFVKHNAPDNGKFQRRPRSQGQIF